MLTNERWDFVPPCPGKARTHQAKVSFKVNMKIHEMHLVSCRSLHSGWSDSHMTSSSEGPWTAKTWVAFLGWRDSSQLEKNTYPGGPHRFLGRVKKPIPTFWVFTYVDHYAAPSGWSRGPQNRFLRCCPSWMPVTPLLFSSYYIATFHLLNWLLALPDCNGLVPYSSILVCYLHSLLVLKLLELKIIYISMTLKCICLFL